MNTGNLFKVISLSLVFLGISSFNSDMTKATEIGSSPLIITRNPDHQSRFYVDPQRGNDQTGEGIEDSPFKTITQALMLSQPGTIIILAPGKYSQESGESFPLLINIPVTIEGQKGNQGHNVVIEGGGTYISPTAAGQNAAVVIVLNATKISGITVTNPHHRGHGIWIESGNPEISYSTFTRNGNTGLSVNGKSKALISYNYFYNNSGNGLSIYGSSEAIVRDNLFEKTGYGISVVDEGKGIITNNQIRGNRVGVIVEAKGEVILRRNLIEQSISHGLVIIAEGKADLGTGEEPGENVIQGNRGMAIQNLTEQAIMAVGNEIEGEWLGPVAVQPPLFAPSSPPTQLNPTQDITQAEKSSSFRVVAEAQGEQEQQVRSLYPDAFKTMYDGKPMLQIGVFTTWENAQRTMTNLQSIGVDEVIIFLDDQ